MTINERINELVIEYNEMATKYHAIRKDQSRQITALNYRRELASIATNIRLLQQKGLH